MEGRLCAACCSTGTSTSTTVPSLIFTSSRGRKTPFSYLAAIVMALRPMLAPRSSSMHHYVEAGGAHLSDPGEGTGAVPDTAATLSQAETGAMVPGPKSGYLQHVDHVSLVAA